jgi:hypothetical protein
MSPPWTARSSSSPTSATSSSRSPDRKSTGRSRPGLQTPQGASFPSALVAAPAGANDGRYRSSGRTAKSVIPSPKKPRSASWSDRCGKHRPAHLAEGNARQAAAERRSTRSARHALTRTTSAKLSIAGLSATAGRYGGTPGGRSCWDLGTWGRPQRSGTRSTRSTVIASPSITYRNPVAVNSQPVVPAPVESLGGERVFGQACDGGADRAHAVLSCMKRRAEATAAGVHRIFTGCCRAARP